MAKIKFSQPLPNNQMYHHTYNDGMLYYGKVKTIREEKTREKIGEKIEEEGKVPFSRATIRENDNQIAESLGYTIDVKVKVPHFENETDCKVKINEEFLNNNEEEVYDIIKKDIGTDKQIYIYLQKVRNEGA